MREINLFKSTVGLGLIKLPDGSQTLIQFKTAREIVSRNFDDVFWVKEPTQELLEAAFYATYHRKGKYKCQKHLTQQL